VAAQRTRPETRLAAGPEATLHRALARETGTGAAGALPYAHARRAA
jgi:hypothetical protein